jgi:histidinol-phosphate aminotransferase
VKLVIGLGLARSATPEDVNAALETTVEAARCTWPDVVEIATVDTKRDHPALAQLTVPVRFLSASALAGVRVPHPSVAVERATGTASVAEAAALWASGTLVLLVPKRCTPSVCTAAASLADPP